MRTHLATREVYKLLGAQEKLGIYFREGKHEHGEADWLVMLDFADERLSWMTGNVIGIDGGEEITV